jgi:hypothetical protein
MRELPDLGHPGGLPRKSEWYPLAVIVVRRISPQIGRRGCGL